MSLFTLLIMSLGAIPDPYLARCSAVFGYSFLTILLLR